MNGGEKKGGEEYQVSGRSSSILFLTGVGLATLLVSRSIFDSQMGLLKLAFEIFQPRTAEIDLVKVIPAEWVRAFRDTRWGQIGSSKKQISCTFFSPSPSFLYSFRDE